MAETIDESAYRIETRTLRTDGGFRGAFRIYVARGAAMVLLHTDHGVDSPNFETEVQAWDDAVLRADRWIAEGGIARLEHDGHPGY